MSSGRPGADFAPRPYRARMSTYWWLHRWRHLKFMLRELSSVAVGYFIVITLLQIRALAQGPESYAAFQDWLQAPVLIVLNMISFLFVVFHTITWFSVTPRAIALRVGGKRLPDLALIAPNYVAWAVISGLVAWFILRG